MIFLRFLIIFIVSLAVVFSPENVFAETTTYRSAGWVGASVTSDNPYTNLSNCQVTDGLYCSRPAATGGTNLYFSSFGTLSDFGIPQGSIINKVHFRVTGKNTATAWIQIGEGNNKPLISQCQSPFDLLKVYLGSVDTVKELHATFSTANRLAVCFSSSRINAQNFTIALFTTGVGNGTWSSDIDNFEIAFDFTPPSTPTPTSAPTATPTMTPTPIPTAVPTPEPFLDLPWEYEGEFSDVALAVSSYFDHEYPLLSAGLTEPAKVLNSVTLFDGFTYDQSERSYTRHDGYDYARLADVRLGDPVLAAAAGWATYINTCGPCGNAIHIDHENGYQTRYYHLQKEGLVTSNPNQPVWVNARQVIGKVGATGNVRPAGDAGAHIHFMMVEDKNKDGYFDDNIPDGLTDPFGWQSEEPDPWENYSFFYNGQQRTGNKSYYLWRQMIPNLREDLPSNGGIFHLGNDEVIFPYDPTRPPLGLTMEYVPYAKESASLVGLTPTLKIVTKDVYGDLYRLFSEHITIKIDFSDVDLSRFDLGTTTFSIYSSDDQGNWVQEPTVIDLTNRTATAQVNHLTYFALMAERKDTIAPVTKAEVQGEKGQDKWYRSDVSISLIAQDNDGGLGVNYTLYKINGEDWQEYIAPLVFTTEGEHTVSFYSVDNDDNIEELKTERFVIDKTPPEAEIYYNLENFDIEVLGHDGSESATVTIQPFFLHPKFTISDQAGNTLNITTDKIKLGKQVLLSINSLQYSNNTPINFDRQIFFTLVIPGEKGTFRQIDQYYSLKGDKKVFTKYLTSKKATQIYTKVPGVPGYTQESKEGIVLLKLSTQNSTLKYSY